MIYVKPYLDIRRVGIPYDLIIINLIAVLSKIRDEVKVKSRWAQTPADVKTWRDEFSALINTSTVLFRPIVHVTGNDRS